MLRQIVNGVLLAAFAGHIILKLATVGYIHTYADYIADTKCEQRDKKDNCCQGSCYVKHLLQETEAPADRNRPISVNWLNVEQLLVACPPDTLRYEAASIEGSLTDPHICFVRLKRIITGIFRPPKVS